MRREIYEADAFRGEYAQEYLAVSHRWMCGNEAPDAAKGAECAQLDAIAKGQSSRAQVRVVRLLVHAATLPAGS